MQPTSPYSGDLEEIDRFIIRALQKNGRESFRQIARDLDVSEATVRNRVKRLQEAGVMNISAIVHAANVGLDAQGFLLIRSRGGTQQEVVDQLIDIPEITYVSTCLGTYNIYAQFVTRNTTSLAELLEYILNRVDNIDTYETFMELKTHKVDYGPSTFSTGSLEND